MNNQRIIEIFTIFSSYYFKKEFKIDYKIYENSTLNNFMISGLNKKNIYYK